MDTTREAELVPIFYREPSREHRTRSLALSALGRCMGMAGSLARAGMNLGSTILVAKVSVMSILTPKRDTFVEFGKPEINKLKLYAK
jgi:hypothetical protein